MLSLARSFIITWFVFCGQAFADVSLDKLNACNDIAAAWTMLAQRSPAVAADCRPAQGRIERALYERTRPQDRSLLCFLSRPPAPFLAGFNCFSLYYGGASQLGCIRERTDVNLDQYFARYATHRESEAAYFAAARACPTSNDDAGVAGRTLFPQPLLLVARHGVAFYASIGQGVTTNSLIWHGYAQLDPEIGGGLAEIVHILIAAETPSAVAPSPMRQNAGQMIGRWRVRIDEAEAFERDAEAMLANTHPGEFYIDFATYDVTRVWSQAEMSQSAPSGSERERQNEVWRQAMVASLEAQDLRELSDAELREYSGVGIEDMRRQWLANASLPYGMRDEVASQLSEHFSVLVTEDAPCASPGRPMMVMAAGIRPAQSNSRDYGGLVLLMIGSCGSRRSSHSMFSRVSERVRDDMIAVWEE
jgi:hypothetical protein